MLSDITGLNANTEKSTSVDEIRETTSLIDDTKQAAEKTEAVGTESASSEIIQGKSSSAAAKEQTLPETTKSYEQTEPETQVSQPTEPSQIMTDSTPSAASQTTASSETQLTTESETQPSEASGSETEGSRANIHVIRAGGGSIDKTARQRGLSPQLQEAGTSPVFMLDSRTDVDLFLEVFDGDPYLTEQEMSEYGQAFFTDHVLFVIYDWTSPSSSKEEYFWTNVLVQNRVLHLRVGMTTPQGVVMTGDTVPFWYFVSVGRSTADQLIAYDASWANAPLPPDWTEAVNPDWRKSE